MQLYKQDKASAVFQHRRNEPCKSSKTQFLNFVGIKARKLWENWVFVLSNSNSSDERAIVFFDNEYFGQTSSNVARVLNAPTYRMLCFRINLVLMSLVWTGLLWNSGFVTFFYLRISSQNEIPKFVDFTDELRFWNNTLITTDAVGKPVSLKIFGYPKYCSRIAKGLKSVFH